MTMNIRQILVKKYPGTEWLLSGDDYSGLEWLDESPKPTEAELEAVAADVEYEVAYEEVELKRQAHMSRSVSQGGSDGLYFRAKRGKGTEQEWKARVAEIEALYPYPEKPVK